MYRTLAVFLTGILIARLSLGVFELIPFSWWHLLIGLFFLILLERFLKKGAVKRITLSICFYLIFFVLGFYCYRYSLPNSITEDSLQATRLYRVKEVLKQKEKAIHLALKLEEGNNSLPSLKGQVFWCHLGLGSTTFRPERGQLIWLNSKIFTLPKPRNPGAFDFGAYLLQKGYCGQIFGSSKQWGSVEESGTKPSLISRWRTYLLQEIESWAWVEENEAVFKALILGYKNDLSKRLKSDFAAAGAMHLLAVSGLHVGIVYLLLSYILVAFTYFRKLQFLRSLILISGIWLYALLSGASPSVLRSATMFSIMAAVYNLERPGSSFRAIFLSAFVLLLFNAGWLFDLGFQLSYSALLGILIWQPKIEKLVKSRFKIIIWLNKLLSVSLAAQIGTLPLALYYFNQFPTYFWLSNILMIPLVTLLMYSGFVLLLLRQSEGLTLFYDMLEQLCSMLIYVNEEIASLPFAVIESISCSIRQALLLGALLVALSLFLIQERKMFLYGAFGILFLFGANNLFQRYTRVSSSETHVYDERSFVASLRKGEDFYVYAADSTQYESFREYLWRDHILAEGLSIEGMKVFKAD